MAADRARAVRPAARAGTGLGRAHARPDRLPVGAGLLSVRCRRARGERPRRADPGRPVHVQHHRPGEERAERRRARSGRHRQRVVAAAAAAIGERFVDRDPRGRGVARGRREPDRRAQPAVAQLVGSLRQAHQRSDRALRSRPARPRGAPHLGSAAAEPRPLGPGREPEPADGAEGRGERRALRRPAPGPDPPAAAGHRLVSARGLALALCLLALAPSARAQLLTESFDDISALPASGWVGSGPGATSPGFQGHPGVFASQAGAPGAYAGSNVVTRSIPQNWLITPVLPLTGGEQIAFYTRAAPEPGFTDTLDVALGQGASTAASNFTVLLLEVGGASPYPNTGWTRYTVLVPVIAGLTSGRIAFEYNSAGNGNYVGIDSLT